MPNHVMARLSAAAAMVHAQHTNIIFWIHYARQVALRLTEALHPAGSDIPSGAPLPESSLKTGARGILLVPCCDGDALLLARPWVQEWCSKDLPVNPRPADKDGWPSLALLICQHSLPGEIRKRPRDGFGSSYVLLLLAQAPIHWMWIDHHHAKEHVQSICAYNSNRHPTAAPSKSG